MPIRVKSLAGPASNSNLARTDEYSSIQELSGMQNKEFVNTLWEVCNNFVTNVSKTDRH